MEEIDKKIIEQINEWFYGKRDYQQGLDLLEKASQNQRSLIKQLKRGNIGDNMQHLTYHLFKISDHVDETVCNPLKVLPTEKNKTFKKEVKPVSETENPILESDDPFIPKSDEDQKFYAQIIAYQKFQYNERMLAHKEMSGLGDNNTEAIVNRRKELLSIIDTITQIVDFIHNQKLAWKETGVKPDGSILQWVPEPEPAAEEKKEVVVDDIPTVDLQLELGKVRSRLSKYAKKMKDLSGKKLDAMKAKQTADLKLKTELSTQINAVRNK